LFSPLNFPQNDQDPQGSPHGGFWQSVEKNLPELYAKALALNPTGRMATPEEIGRGIVFLASPASSFTTGTNLVIDGALTRGVQL
jgi:3-oxoacyl-[acyl-carrier protein] reductase